MDNLENVCCLIQLIVRQILIFLQSFFYEFTPAEKNLDDIDSKIRTVEPHHAVADIFVLLAICGLLFVFMNLSANSPKTEASNYGTSNTEMISMAFEEDPSSFWYSKSANSSLINYFRTCNDSIRPLRDVVPKNISCPTLSKDRISPQSRISNYNARSSCLQHYLKTQANRVTSQTTPREWLIRHTRSGHVYGKYPI